jgi:endonuclease-3
MLPLFPHEDSDRARKIAERLQEAANIHWEEHDLQRFKHQPFSTMIAAMLSPRTRTQDSRAATRTLFSLADTPDDMAKLPYEQILAVLRGHDITYPENKARYVIASSKRLAASGEDVPRDLNALMQFPGMGWKTSLLTLWIAYRLAPQICVDVHVRRIAQRLGLVDPTTQNPQAVSRELMDIVPPKLWGIWNPIMVYFGKHRCYPIEPNCNGCPVYDLCERVGVNRK